MPFAADVIKRNRQLILVLRECVTSFTSSTLIDDERHQTLRDALIRLCIELRPLDGPPAVIRSDPAPGFNALTNDELLRQHRITLEIGRTKNINKNPVAEKAVQELEMELLRQDPLNGTVTPLSLSAATATLNSRIRSRGLSAREMWTQRDQFSGSQLPVNDRDLITEQHNERLRNHPFSVKAKAPSGKSITPPPTSTPIAVNQVPGIVTRSSLLKKTGVISRSSEGHSYGTLHIALNAANVTKYPPTSNPASTLSLLTPQMMKMPYAPKHHLHNHPRLRIFQLKYHFPSMAHHPKVPLSPAWTLGHHGVCHLL